MQNKLLSTNPRRVPEQRARPADQVWSHTRSRDIVARFVVLDRKVQRSRLRRCVVQRTHFLRSNKRNAKINDLIELCNSCLIWVIVIAQFAKYSWMFVTKSSLESSRTIQVTFTLHFSLKVHPRRTFAQGAFCLEMRCGNFWTKWPGRIAHDNEQNSFGSQRRLARQLPSGAISVAVRWVKQNARWFAQSLSRTLRSVHALHDARRVNVQREYRFLRNMRGWCM